MNIYRDIGKVLLKLDDNYYEKGIKKISVSLNGIRSEKIPHMSRRVIIPQLIRSKECDKFIQQFIENLRERVLFLKKIGMTMLCHLKIIILCFTWVIMYIKKSWQN